MRGIGDEPAPGGDAVEKGADVLLGQLVGAPTRAADEVLMGGFVGEVVHGGTMTEVAVGQGAGFLEGIERPVDRRRIDLRFAASARRLEDPGGGQMLAVGGGDDLADRPSRCGDPHPARLQRGDEGVGADVHPLSL